ncbi:argininosuccinate lyase [Phlebotomus argentipes]|uniref:argininosuccinate lyase n=1 Tax=Phlebotomus argentipes TaxID=94469 RepID=UPI002892EB4B|nr:argininosuccinate lyase [Phlebotomus argentipes]
MACEEKKLWGGRFCKATNEELVKLNNSLDVDRRLFAEDIQGSCAYAKALFDRGIYTREEFEKTIEGLQQVLEEWKCGEIVFQDSDEDVHTVNERRLTELIGDVGGKLHTGRSRNDQVVTDMRLWLKKAIKDVTCLIVSLLEVILERSRERIDVLMPGYTHLQRAQAVRFSHWLMSHGFALQNDFQRFQDLLKRVDALPLGSGAIAGNPFGVDRQGLAKNLSFSSVIPNSMIAVGDRDFISEFTFVSSMCGVHLSRLAEDLIIYSTREFGFITISEEFSTGSSLMPQKRNPDSLELIRGISGQIFGNHAGFMMSLKGLPSTYNKDLQSDKISMFSTFDNLSLALKVTQGVVQTLEVNEKKCREALSYETLATDLAYYLVRKGIPFRVAHHASGEVVAFAENNNISLRDVPLVKLKAINSAFAEDVLKIWNFENSVEQYSSLGGTSRNSVKTQIATLAAFIAENTKIN